jgi:hypothetical protein
VSDPFHGKNLQRGFNNYGKESGIAQGEFRLQVKKFLRGIDCAQQAMVYTAWWRCGGAG